MAHPYCSPMPAHARLILMPAPAIWMDRQKRTRSAPGINSKLGSPGLTRHSETSDVEWASRMVDSDEILARGLPNWRDHPDDPPAV